MKTPPAKRHLVQKPNSFRFGKDFWQTVYNGDENDYDIAQYACCGLSFSRDRTGATTTSTTTMGAYLENGAVTSVTDPGGRTTAYTYDVMGRRLTVMTWGHMQRCPRISDFHPIRMRNTSIRLRAADLGYAGSKSLSLANETQNITLYTHLRLH